MAKRLIEEFLDDINGAGGAITHRFSVHGIHYEIDLAEDNAADFEADMARWIEHARLDTDTARAGRTATKAAKPGARSGARPDQNGSQALRAEVRDWWAGNADYVKGATGRDYAVRGRLPDDVLRLYAASMRPAPPAPGPSDTPEPDETSPAAQSEEGPGDAPQPAEGHPAEAEEVASSASTP